MHRYIFKRLFFLIPIILGVTFIIFTIMNFVPGDPGSFILGPGALQEDIDRVNDELGYNRPFIERYLLYIYNAFIHFDLGNSYASKVPVLEEVSARLPISVMLAFVAVCIAIIVGVPLGVLSAVKQYSLLDKSSTSLAMLFTSIPLFLLGMIMMLAFALKLQWFPATGIGSLRHFALPMLSIGLSCAGQQFRFTRASMLETIRQDYVRTARAKGAPERDVIWRHAMKNALLPVITVAGNNFGVLIASSVVIETLFGIPGLGVYIVTGVKQMDVPVVMGGLTVFALVFSVTMLLVDISYAFADPRIKAKYRK